MRIMRGFKEKRIKGNVWKVRKKWLPCETPHWRRNAPTLHPQRCVSRAVRVSPSRTFPFTVHATGWHWHRRGSQSTGADSRQDWQGGTWAALSPVPVPTKAAPRQQAARAARGAGSPAPVWRTWQQQSVEQRPRLVWLNRHAPSHVCIGQHHHQINF